MRLLVSVIRHGLLQIAACAAAQACLQFRAMSLRVSIVVPMYNAEHYLASTVESILGQTFEDWELVLFDDGSRDRTLEIAHEFARRDRRIRVVQDVNGGTAAARNRGFAATSTVSDFIIFMDNDDTWEPDALRLLIEALDGRPEYAAAHGLARAIDPQGNRYPGNDLAQSMAHRREVRDGRIVDVTPGSPTTFEALLVENFPVTPGTVLVRRSIFDALGGYFPEAVPCDDWDMNVRIARRGGIALVNKVILNWRRHPNAASHTTRRWRHAYLLVRIRTVASPDNDPRQRAAAISAFAINCRDAWAQVARHLLGGRVGPGVRALARSLLYQTTYWRTLRRRVAS
jgi:glycosyltransferase involved in cell wall biosynthesis